MTFEKWLNLIQPELKSIYEKMKKVELVDEPYYYQQDKAHVVELDPLSLSLFVEKHRGDDVELANLVNASFVWWDDYPLNRDPYSLSMLVYKDEIFSNRQPNGFWEGEYKGLGAPTPTFIIYKDGGVEVKLINNIKGVGKSVHLAVTIVETNPVVSAEGFWNYVPWSSIAYQANRIGIFYRKKDDKILLVYHPEIGINNFSVLADTLEVDFGGSLDSGGSANFKVDGNDINTTSRCMIAGLTW